MDYVWNAFYDVGLTSSPSLASVPIFPKQCQRDLYQHYEVDPEIIGQGSFACIRRVKLRRQQQQHLPNCPTAASKGNDDNGNDDADSGNLNIPAASPSDDAAIYDRSYACKTILKSKLYDKELFRREVYNLNRCQSNSNIKSNSDNKNNNSDSDSNNNCVIRLLDVLEDRSSIHIVTELCEGGELFDYVVNEHDRASKGLRGKALSPSSSHGDGISDGDETRCATIVYQILTAIVFLHEEASVCHRDLKASNFVFVQKPSFVSDASLTLKVIDFGLSKFVGKCQEENTCRNNDIQKDTNNGVQVLDGTNTDLVSTISKVDGVSNDESSSSHQDFSIWGAIKATYFSETPVTHDCSTTDDDKVATNMAESRKDAIPPTRLASTNVTEQMEDDECDSCDNERLLYSKHYRYMTSEVGTPYYVAPEVLKQHQGEDHQTQSTIVSLSTATPANDDRHHNNSNSNSNTTSTSGYTTKCDVWSIGVIAFFTLTGTLPVLGEDERDTVRMLMDPNLEVDFTDETLWEQQDVAVEEIDNRDHQDDIGSSNKQKKPKISNSALVFCKALLQKDPRKRPTAREALEFDWITKHCGKESALALAPSPLASSVIKTKEPPRHRQQLFPLPSLSRMLFSP